MKVLFEIAIFLGGSTDGQTVNRVSFLVGPQQFCLQFELHGLACLCLVHPRPSPGQVWVDSNSTNCLMTAKAVSVCFRQSQLLLTMFGMPCLSAEQQFVLCTFAGNNPQLPEWLLRRQAEIQPVHASYPTAELPGQPEHGGHSCVRALEADAVHTG